MSAASEACLFFVFLNVIQTEHRKMVNVVICPILNADLDELMIQVS